MKTIDAAKFKEQCMSLIEKVDKEGIIITKYGKSLAKLVPIELKSSPLLGKMKGKIKITGDILSTGLKWDV